MSTDGKITLKIATPAGPFEHTFEATSKVHEVVAIVVKAMGLKEGDAFELAYDGVTLSNEREIGSYKVDDGAVLDLIASGSAV